MEVKQLLKNKLYKASAVLGLSLLSFTSQAQTINATVENLDSTDPLSMWRSYRNVFENNGAFEANGNLAYIFGDQWVTFAELKSVLTPSNNTIALYPNYSLYNASDAYWANGAMGNKIFEGLTFVERTDMEGKTLVFSGHTDSSSLIDSYHDTAFIKVLNPGANYATVFSYVVNLQAGEDFTISSAGFVIPAGHIVQYGFSVIGLNGNPASEAVNGNTVITSAEPGELTPPVVPGEPTEPNPGEVSVTIGASTANLTGYMNWFKLDETYLNGNTWDFPNLKSVFNSDGSIDLHPNFSVWGNGANSEWVNNGVGQRIMEGNTYIDDESLLGDDVTFSGHCFSNTLADGYEGIAFIKVLDAGYQLVNYTHVPLVGGEDFEITVGPDDYANGAHFQYGFSVTGVNADPANEAALGFAKIGAATASVKDFTKSKVVMYPNPASNILNITAENTIDTIEVYNLLGQMVLSAKPGQDQAALNVSSLNSGVYIVNTNIAGTLTSARFVKQ